MSRSKTILTAAILLATMMLPALISAQSKPEGEQPGAASQDDSARPRGRLPNHFGKLGISDEQRTRIY